LRPMRLYLQTTERSVPRSGTTGKGSLVGTLRSTPTSRSIKTSMSSELAALEELKGRCLAIQVAYLDTGVRMGPAVVTLNKFLGEAVKRPLFPQETQELAEEILDIREYLKDVLKKYPEVKREFEPTIKVCDYLVSID
jgi:hypothetical protein